MTMTRADAVWPSPPGGFAGSHRAGVAAALAASALGFMLALVITQWPVPGMAIPVGIAAIVIACRWPQWMMLAFAVSLAIPIQRTLAGLPLNASDGLLVLWCLLRIFMMQRADRPHARSLALPAIWRCIAPFLLAAMLAQIGSITPSSSIKQVLRLAEWFLALPLALMVFAPDERFRRFAGVTLMVVPCLFALDGIVEFVTHGRSLSGMIGIPVPVPEGGDNQIRHTFDVSGRAGSTFGGAQGLAMYLVMSMSVAIAHILKPPQPWMRMLAVLCLAICIGGLVVAESRGGLLGALALLLAMGMTLRASVRIVAVAGVLLLGTAATLALGIWPTWDGTLSGLVPGRPEAVLDRLIIWGVVRDVMAENPFFGVGLGNFRDAFFAREPWLHVELGYSSLHAHNTYLEVLADTGWVGLLSYLAFIGMVARRLLVLWRACEADGAQAVFTLAAIGSLAAYIVFAMVDMLLLQNMHMLLVLVLTLGLTHPRAAQLGLGTPASKEAS